ncbi:LysM peptidoglycan-binding domain-containing protein [Candidatus Saccharibacteria bacterium]|nr:LysM peptidoglycan-binding domain-containing protein [Candidatus Saccharibacteria bacterium]
MSRKSTKKSSKSATFKRFLPYFGVFMVIMAIAYFGSLNKTTDTSQSNSSMESIASNNYAVSADQLSEFYIVSELASAMQLPTAEAVNVNYNSLTALKDIAQTTTDKIEKPDIVDTSGLVHGGFINYTVGEGESLDTIAGKYGVSVTQIRWSNGLKTSDVSTGTELRIPVVPGIIYTTKSGETLQGIAEKYGSPVDQIIAYNDLSSTESVPEGTILLLPSGELPENERPEGNTANGTAYTNNGAINTDTSSYYANHTYWTSSNPMPYGWCTWYAWARRSQMGGNYTLPGGLGNANMWAAALSGSFAIDRSPQPGDVFQSNSGWYGHVGIVDSVNSDGTITISDMNGIAGWGRVGSATVPQSVWSTYQYIHGRY